jgi:hypothetical protein
MQPFMGFMFSQEDLDMVLYGYTKNKVGEQLPGHALTGLRISELSHGELHYCTVSPSRSDGVKGGTPVYRTPIYSCIAILAWLPLGAFV